MINRYVKSFFITFFLYTILIVSFFAAIKTTDKIQNNNTVSISVINENRSKEFEKNKQPQKLQKTVKKERYREKEAKAYKTVYKEKKEGAFKKHLIAKSNERSIQDKNSAVNNRQSKIKNQKEEPTLSSESIKNNFLARIRGAINANKSYPALAKRREIEGKIDAAFTINGDGSVSNIVILEGNSILKGAARRAIEKSFPVEIPDEIKNDMPLKLNITLNFKLIET